MPLWLLSCHRRKLEKIASRPSITPSPLPPFHDLSYRASARNPFRVAPAGAGPWGVVLPNSSLPLSIVPSLSRSKTNHASSESASVQDSLSFVPSLFKSKFTPPAASVRSNPLPATSMTIGVSESQKHVSGL